VHDRAKHPAGGKIVAWEIFTEWSDLQFVNYSISEDLEDGTVAAWRMEDWEIYGPGAGGYTSSGPYGDWQSDILSWLNNGSMIAQDIIDWDASQLQAHNLSTHTQESAGLTALTTYYLNGSSYLPQDPNPTFGLAGTAKYVEGDIVVTGARSHSDQSISYRFATVDPFTHQSVTWVENVSFLDAARTNADANVIQFDLAENELPLSETEQAAIDLIQATVLQRIADLRTLDPDGYFDVEGWGRIRVSELISLLTLTDWTIHPQTTWHPTPPLPGESIVNGDMTRNGGNPEIRINRAMILNIANSPARLDFFIFHELAHATRRGWEHRGVTHYEEQTNDVATAVIARLGRQVYPNPSAFTAIQYRPGTPGT
jgi:hypothetical protein